MALGSSGLSPLLEAHGYAFVSEYLPEKETVEAISQVGNVQRLAGTNEKQTLTPLESSDSTPNTYSGNYGRGEFPLHTDLAHWSNPPKYLVLRCIVGAQNVATRLIDSRIIVSAFSRDELRRVLVQPRRAISGRRPLLRLLDTASTETEIFRWDMLFTQPATDFSRRVISAIQKFVATLEEKRILLLSKGDTLIVDNWRMLHGRSSVDQSSIHRKVERVYMDGVY